MGTAPRSAEWRTSSFSSNGSDCVELATDGQTWGAVRDSKKPDAGELVVGVSQFRSFLGMVRSSGIEA